MPQLLLSNMIIKIKKECNGDYYSESPIDFSLGGRAQVFVECCNHGYDEVLLRRGAESYLNQIALSQGMRVLSTIGDTQTVPVSVQRGESARVRCLKFPVEILPL